MRVLFFGSSGFAEPSLCRLASTDGIQLVGVVTQCDRPQGRGRKSGCTPIRTCADQLGLTILQPQSVRDPGFIEHAKSLEPDVIVLASYGQIIPKAVLDLPPMGPVNIHPSLLPAFRGAAPVQRAIMAGLGATGVCTMLMVPRLDAGDILLCEDVAIRSDETAGQLLGRLAAIGADLLIDTLERLQQGTCPRTPQDDRLATFAPLITAGDCEINWSAPAEAIHNQVRGLAPTPGARTGLGGCAIKVLGSRLEGADAEAGVVAAIGRDGVQVGTGKGSVTLTEVQPQSSRIMTAAEWARGARVQVGNRLGVDSP